MNPILFKIPGLMKLADMQSKVYLGMFDFVGDAVSDTLETILHNTIYTLCYYITKALCFIIRILDSMFRVVAGIDEVQYLGGKSTLLDVFFGHSLIQTVYIGMATIGIAMAFAFALIAVIRKTADLEDTQRTTHYTIIKNLFKTIIIIGGLTFFMQVVLKFSDILMGRINFLFDNATTLGKEEIITYTDEEYAAMARVLNTLGNYSINPSYRSRYNIDACYNDIRKDLLFLWESKKFDVYYDSDNGNTWQSVIQSILNTTSPKSAIKSDVYYGNVSSAVLNAMSIVKNDNSLKALKEFDTKYKKIESSTPLDITIFLMGSMNAAMNEAYNENPAVNDPLRYPYYVQKKSIYDFDQVDKDFNISISKMDYVIIWISCFVCMFNLAQLIFSCIGRIFNMLLLYIAAPPLVSTYPLDNGGKLKQWFTAFIIQCFAVFGTVIAMRLLILFLPIVASSDLVVFPNVFANLMAKLVIILGATMTAGKANSLITGILADNAGMQAIGSAERESARGEAAVKAVGGVGWGATKLAAGMGWGATKLAGKGTWWAGKKAVGAIKNARGDDTGSQKDLNESAHQMDKMQTQTEDATFSGGSISGGGGGGGTGHQNPGTRNNTNLNQPNNTNPQQQRNDYNAIRNIADNNNGNDNNLPNNNNGNNNNGNNNNNRNNNRINDAQFQNLFGVPRNNNNNNNNKNIVNNNNNNNNNNDIIVPNDLNRSQINLAEGDNEEENQ